VRRASDTLSAIVIEQEDRCPFGNRWAVANAATTTLVIVFDAGYAAAAANQFQGTSNKE
jgi:hypothetical protein